MAKKFTYEEVKRYFDEQGCKLVTEEYINRNQILEFICKCGRRDEKTFDKFKNRNSICRTCAKNKQNSSRKLSYQKVYDTFSENECELLEKKYKNSKTPMKYICKCGEIAYTTYERMAIGQHCRKCSHRKTSYGLLKYTIQQVHEIFEKQGCELLSEEYKTVRDKLSYKCVCGNKSIVRFSAFLSGARCKNCAIENQIGEKNLAWKESKTDEERIKGRKFREYSLWRREIFERDKYQCKLCLKEGGKLTAHHLDGWNWCLEKRLEVSNGVTLCADCHDGFHDKYGKGDNTREQYEEWSRNKREQGA